MKNIKTLFLAIILIAQTYCAVAQSNSLSAAEYSNLKFDNVSIQDIIDTSGNTSTMQSLFNNALTIEQGFSEAVEHWIKFTKNSICIEFYNGIQEGSVITYDLGSIEIEGNSSVLDVKSKQLKIGDSGNLLSGLNSRTVNGKKIYGFGFNSYDSYAYVYVDISSNKIIEIGYNGNLL